MAVPVTKPAPDHGRGLGYETDLERIEIELLLEGVYRHYGFDFRSYAYASIRRRLLKRTDAEGLRNISELHARILHDTDAMELLLLDLSVNVTAMFRDPSFYQEFRAQVVPLLRTYPVIRIWQRTGCFGNRWPGANQICIDLDELLLICRHVFFCIDRVNWAFCNAYGAVDTFVRINHQKVWTCAEAVYWAYINAIGIAAADAGFGHNVGHNSPI